MLFNRALVGVLFAAACSAHSKSPTSAGSPAFEVVLLDALCVPDSIGDTMLICSNVVMLDYPAPFNASHNPHRKTAADPYLEFPYDKAGPNARWMYPCRGYEKLLGELLQHCLVLHVLM